MATTTPDTINTPLPFDNNVLYEDEDGVKVDSDISQKPIKSSKDRRSSIDAPETSKRYVKAHQQAFLSDEEIPLHWFWRVFVWLIWPINHFFHHITFPNFEEKCDPSKPFLSINMHTTHNADISYGIVATQKTFGRVSRGLVHRNVMLLSPWLAYIGMVPGYRDTAVQLLKQGFWVGVIPGGGEEAMTGHENAYNLDWPAKRRGFAKVAIKAQVPILPVFYQNCEEMRWNPLLWLWNKTYYGSRIYDTTVAARIPYISSIVKVVAEFVWFFVATFFSIPMPAKVTAYVGDPIECNEDSDIDEIREKAYNALKSLIAEHQPNGVDRWRAFQMWVEDWKQSQQRSKQL